MLTVSLTVIIIFCFVVIFFLLAKVKKRGWRSSQNDFQHELDIEKTINYFATSLFGQNSVDDILWDVAKNCISRLNFEDCVIYLFNDKGDKLIQKAAFGPKNIDEYKIYNPIEIPVGKGVVGTVAKTGIHEIIQDTSKDERYIPDDKFRYSEITVPIKYQGKVIGVIDSEHSEKKFFTSRHLQILTTISSLCANKIVKAKADDEIRMREKQILEIDRNLAEAKLTAFRAQMNPHFIFNCMSAIQECILNNKPDEANDYLSKFSRLMRMVLENSDRNNVAFEKEIEMLQLYLQLESARLKGSFTYQLSIDEKIEQQEMMIPAMVIQPFVENAIWHGLLNKKGSRKLTVGFKPSEDALICEIEDNGIGRTSAAEISRRRKNHVSRGLKMIEEKLELMKSQLQGVETGMKIIDLYDNQQNPAGTKVVIRLPVFSRPF